MKNFENFQLSNAGKRFLTIVIGMVLFFALAGLNKLAAQNCKDPLGYGIYFNTPSEKGAKPKAYITYNPSIYRPNEKKDRIVLDSLYIDLGKSSFNYYSNSGENAVSKIYFCSDGKEIFIHLNIEDKRSKKNWPEVDRIISKFYGQKTGNTIFIREETQSEFLRKGWSSPIINFCIIILLTLLWIIEKYKDMKRGFYLEDAYVGGVLLLVYSIFSALIALISENGKWALICLILYSFILVINLIGNAIYDGPILKKRQEERLIN
jgi:hypothetical protein